MIIGLLGLALVTGVLVRPAGAAPAEAPNSMATKDACPNEEDPDLDYLCSDGPTYTIPGLTDINGWDEPEHFHSILTGDLDGDGMDELLVRSTGGFQVYRFDAELGQWSQVPIDPILPDHDEEYQTDWTQAKYYTSFQVGDLDGDGREELVARASIGILVFRYSQDTTSETPEWKWTQVSGNHPFADANRWGDDPKYYSTIQLVPLGRADPAVPTMQLFGRGSDGLTMQRWTGSGWQRFGETETEFGDAHGWDKPYCYRSIKAWNEDLLIGYCERNVYVYRFSLDQGWQRVGDNRLSDDQVRMWQGWSSPLEPLRGHEPDGQPVIVLHTSRGAVWATFDLTTKGWTYHQPKQPAFDGLKWYEHPGYYETLQAADLDGDGKDELIGRGGTGVEEYRPDVSNDTWTGPLAKHALKLTDDPWDESPSYYQTLQAVDLDPDGTAESLIGRGPHGIRTWVWDAEANTWTRPRGYADFPTLDSKAYTYLSRTFLGIERGTIREVYRRDSTTQATLNTYRTALERTCTNETRGNPPTFETCTAPSGSGVTDAVWTTTANQIIAELYWATWTLGYFATLDNMQTHLFLDEGNALPTINEDLKLAQAEAAAQPEGVDWLDLIESVLDIVAAVIPEVKSTEKIIKILEVTAGALGVTASVLPAFTHEGDEEMELANTYKEVRIEMGTLQDEMTIALQDHRRYITSDYGLMATVGHLASAQIWTFDTKAALSVSRLQFTKWVYKQFLPVLWERYIATACETRGTYLHLCKPPNNGPWMRAYRQREKSEMPRGVDFDGLFPIQTRPNGTWHWYQLDGAWQPVIEYVKKEISEECTYNPETGKGAWIYGKCGLGMTEEELYGLDFAVTKCSGTMKFMGYDFTCDDPIHPHGLVAGEVRNMGSDDGELLLEYQESVTGPVDLRGATVTVHDLMEDVAAGEDLLAHPDGTALFPRYFRVTNAATPTQASFGTYTVEPWDLAGSITYEQASGLQRGTLKLKLDVDGVTIDDPRVCDAPDDTRWHQHNVRVELADGQIVQFLETVPWHCVTSDSGEVTLEYGPPEDDDT